jgi:adenylate kinase family enzyme
VSIIKIHGCSGAGKTTAVRELLEYPRDVIFVSSKIEAYQVWPPGKKFTHVLGSYANTCGGMDTVSDAGKVIALVDKYAPLGNVVFEGLLQSTYYGKMGAASVPYGDKYIYAFLDTPIELCLERVVARRAASGRNNKFNPELTRIKHDTIRALQIKLHLQGLHRVVTLKHDQPLTPQLMELLE